MARKDKRKAPQSADTSAVSGVRGFAGIPKCVIVSEAYTHLSMIARAILVEIVARFDGHNNGCIAISYAELAARLNRRNQAPIGPAIAELMQHGLIALSAESVWRERKAREYRLTFASTSDSIGRTIRATNDYLKFDATDVVATKRKSATTFVAGRPETATDGVAGPNGKLPKTPDGSATNGVVPICKPYPPTNSEGLDPDNLPPFSGASQNRDRKKAVGE